MYAVGDRVSAYTKLEKMAQEAKDAARGVFQLADVIICGDFNLAPRLPAGGVGHRPRRRRLAGDTLTVNAATAQGTVFADQLERLTGGAPIVVRNATRKATGNGVTVTGKGSLLNVADMPVTATASRGGDITVRFTLIDGRPGMNSWHFSHSFPDLPNFNSGARPDTHACLLHRGCKPWIEAGRGWVTAFVMRRRRTGRRRTSPALPRLCRPPF